VLGAHTSGVLYIMLYATQKILISVLQLFI